MEDISDISSRPLTSLSHVTKQLLSSLLNSTKVLPFEGRSRDWRGIAALTGISSEVEANILGYNDKFGRVLDLWIANQGGTIGELLQHLITLDRYDVYDDLVESVRQHMHQRPDNQVAIANNNICNNNIIVRGDDSELITFQDRPGHRHQYHAFILSAEQDADFTNMLRSRLSAMGFELCSSEDIRPGAPSLFPSVAKLIEERCQRVILIYSPDFLTCKDNTFLRDYTQYYSIQQNARMMVPIVYRPCDPPAHVRMYTSLPYARRNFWQRLVQTLDTPLPRTAIPNGPAPAPLPSSISIPKELNDSTHSCCKIETVSSSQTDDDRRYFYNLPSVPTDEPTQRTTDLTNNKSELNSGQISNSASTISFNEQSLSRDLLLPGKQKAISSDKSKESASSNKIKNPMKKFFGKMKGKSCKKEKQNGV